MYLVVKSGTENMIYVRSASVRYVFRSAAEGAEWHATLCLTPPKACIWKNTIIASMCVHSSKAKWSWSLTSVAPSTVEHSKIKYSVLRLTYVNGI